MLGDVNILVYVVIEWPVYRVGMAAVEKKTKRENEKPFRKKKLFTTNIGKNMIQLQLKVLILVHSNWMKAVRNRYLTEKKHIMQLSPIKRSCIL